MDPPTPCSDTDNNAMVVSSMKDADETMGSDKTTTTPISDQKRAKSVIDENLLAQLSTPEDDRKIWEYVLENHERFSPGSRMFWKEHIGKSRWRKCPAALMLRFNDYLLPNLPNYDIDIKLKLKILKQLEIPVSEDCLKNLKKEFQVSVDENQCVVWWKQLGQKAAKPVADTTRPLKRRISKETEKEKEKVVKKPKQKPLIVTKVVPGNGTKHPEISVVTPKPEVIEDEPYQWSMAGSLNDTDRSDNMSQESEYSNYYQEDKVKIEPMDCGVPNRLVYPEAVTPIVDEQLVGRIVGEVTKNLQGAIGEAVQTSVQRSNESLQLQMTGMSATISTLQGDMENMRSQMNFTSSPNPIEKLPTKKESLTSLNNWISSLRSPKMAPIQQRIEAEIQKIPENDEAPFQADPFVAMFDFGLRMMGI